MIIILLLFPVLLFSQHTCNKVDFKRNHIEETKIEMNFQFYDLYLKVEIEGNFYYYKIKKKVITQEYKIYWINNYRMFVYDKFILQIKPKIVTTYSICDKM